jgi:hypothetical protein
VIGRVWGKIEEGHHQGDRSQTIGDGMVHLEEHADPSVD